MTRIFLEHLPVDARSSSPTRTTGSRSTWSGRRTRTRPSRSGASTSSSAGPDRRPPAARSRSGERGPRGRPRRCAPSSRFCRPACFRALVALWLVSTVVFVVMRLSGDPVPLLLPPDAPRSEIFRVRAELGLDRPLPVQYAMFLAQTLRGRLRPLDPLPRAGARRRARAAARHPRARAHRVSRWPSWWRCRSGSSPRCKRNSPVDHAAMGLALVGQAAPTFFIGILFILLALAQGWVVSDLRARRLATPGAARAHAGAVHHGLGGPAHPLGHARGAARRLHPHGARQGPRASRSSSPSTRSRTRRSPS